MYSQEPGHVHPGKASAIASRGDHSLAPLSGHLGPICAPPTPRQGLWSCFLQPCQWLLCCVSRGCPQRFLNREAWPPEHRCPSPHTLVSSSRSSPGPKAEAWEFLSFSLTSSALSLASEAMRAETWAPSGSRGPYAETHRAAMLVGHAHATSQPGHGPPKLSYTGCHAGWSPPGHTLASEQEASVAIQASFLQPGIRSRYCREQGRPF